MNITELLPWLIGINTAISIGTAVYTAVTLRSKANSEKITDHNKRITALEGDKAGIKVDNHERKLIDHDRRIQAVEGELKHLPVKEDVHGLLLAVERLNGGLSRLEATYDGLGSAVKRIEGFLLGAKGSD